MRPTTLLLIGLSLTLAACSGSQAQPDLEATAVAIADTKVAETLAAQPEPSATDSETPIPTSATPTITPTVTETPVPPTATWTATATLSPTATTPPIPANPILVYYVDLDTPGPAGCGDTMIPVRTTYERTGDPVLDVHWALTSLFSNHSPTVLGLHNAYAPWVLQVDEIVYEAGNDHLHVYVSGRYIKSNQDRCENMRVVQQIRYTVVFNTDVKSFDVWVNGQTMKDALLGD